MDASYSWHPGAHRIAEIGIIPTPLLPDEILSSWLTRAALFQGCDPLVLTGTLWPGWRAWTRDLDRGLDNARLQVLASVSGLDPAVLHTASLRPILATVISGSPDGLAIWPWVLTLGSRNRKRLGGLQYCPTCLAEDKKPYFRLQWRLAWHTCCEFHGIRLLDKCSQCGAPIEPHRLSATDGDIAVCATCKCDLRNTTALNPSKDALEFQRDADQTAKHRQGMYGRENLSSSEWFDLCRYFLTLLRKAASGRYERLLTMLNMLSVNIETLTPPVTGLAFELLPVSERSMLLERVCWLIKAGPDRYLNAGRASFHAKSLLWDGRHHMPSCIETIAHTVSDAGVHNRRKKRIFIPKQRSKRSVLRMWARLQRKIHGPAR